MIVYQVLKRLTGSVHVKAVADDSEYRDWVDEDNPRESKPGGSKGPAACAQEAFVSDPRPAHVSDFYTEDGMVDPSSVVDYARHADGRWYEKAIFRREMVTWLNHPPGETTSKELAVAFITVSRP